MNLFEKKKKEQERALLLRKNRNGTTPSFRKGKGGERKKEDIPQKDGSMGRKPTAEDRGRSIRPVDGRGGVKKMQNVPETQTGET